LDYVFKRGRTEEAAEYALHIQCSWRIAKGNKIEDINEHTMSPRTGLENENEHFEWDIQGNNRFDERIASFIKDINEHTIVERVDSDEVGGLKIFLSQGYLLEVFPDTSEDRIQRVLETFQAEGRQLSLCCHRKWS